MRKGGGKTIRLNPVDQEHQVHDHPARANLEALMDQKLFFQRIKSERASAYWFAASLWGVSGLVLGALLGVFLSVLVQTGTTPLIRDNIISGAAMDEARDTVNSRPPMLTDPAEQPAQEPQQP
ncbi:MAG TPA: hypothetical protein VEA80_19265 [Vitreimonas sp.]|uniref:hypothetical protein n=1 Tax=Vitreimonas sp. TaxID=3069702 RepID=UPI002D54927E|nr:hypothetical protein [Vitreimonas sp.]HYD89629.1 hypothetical protein [Vitreimonas sp.]